MAFTLSLVLSDLAVARWWPRSEQRTAYQVLAQAPATGSVSAQDRYVPHLSLRTLVTVFPVELGRVDYVLVNLDYPWDELPEVTLERAGDTVTITPAGRQALRFAVAALASSAQFDQ